MKNLPKALKTILMLSAFTCGVIVIIIVGAEWHKVPKKRKIPEANFNDNKPYHYYLDLKYKYKNFKDSDLRDSKGVRISYIKGQVYYHPVTIAEYAIGAFETYWDEKDEDALRAFRACLNWFKQNMAKNGCYMYEPIFGLYHEPWCSAMAQGEIASVFVRGFLLTGDTSYLDYARRAIIPVLRDVSLGGISIVRENYIFPQEYPPDKYALNGAIFAYWGIWDLWRVTQDSLYLKACDNIINAFIVELPRFDTGWWSLYQLNPPLIASMRYHQLHIQQLRVLYIITGQEEFKNYSEKWQKYIENPWNRLRFVLWNNYRRVKEFRVKDIKKIPDFLKRLFL